MSFLSPGDLVKVKSLSHVQLFVTPWTVAYHAPQSMEFSRQKYWSGLPFPSPGDRPNPGTEPGSPALQADSLATREAALYFSLANTKINQPTNKNACFLEFWINGQNLG